jgi:acetyl-CoA acetyltransferase family protein
VAQLSDAVIVGYVRSAFSRSRPREPERDVFNNIRVDELSATLVKELIKRAGITGEDIDELIVGAARAVDEQSPFGGRMVVFLSELPLKVSAHYVDRQCGSSMTTAHNGAMEIAFGFSKTVISVGMEHMTHLPMGGPAPGSVPGKPGPFAGPSPKLFSDPKIAPIVDLPTTMNMGLTAEKLAKFAGITREEMDKWAFRSHNLAGKAIKEGYFKGEILPVEGTLPDGRKVMVEVDQAVRGDTTLEQMASLKPAYVENGIITAGNASPLNAGVSTLLLMSRDEAKKHGLKPIASFVSMGFAGVDPTMMGMGPVPASKRALAAAGLSVKDIDFWEINEAFSVVTLYAIRELGINPEIVNIKGGALAIGHPLGASGSRLLGTLARILQMEKGKYGLATMCCGGGQGIATIIKKEE